MVIILLRHELYSHFSSLVDELCETNKHTLWRETEMAENIKRHSDVNHRRVCVCVSVWLACPVGMAKTNS